MKEEKEKKLKTEPFIAILAAAGIAFSLFFQYINPLYAFYAPLPLYVVLGVGGTLLVWDLIKKLFQFEFGSDLLAGISIVTSVLLGEYLAGSLVVLMLSGGVSLENFAIQTASRVLEALSKRAPTIGHRKKNELIEDIAVSEIQIGDTLLIFPHEICPVDGEVIAGDSVMDESYLTGEPFLISKAPGSLVMSGAINGDGALTIRATKLAENSQYAKIMQVMKESEQKKPRIRRLADQLGAWYTPLALFIAFFAWAISGDATRFLAVTVIATPCPLLIAIPVAIIGSISLCAKRGILIKNPLVLEQIDLCKTMIFDKTGTLTIGSPKLASTNCYHDWDVSAVLSLVASLERYSRHPLAEAILQEATQAGLKSLQPERVSEKKGEGLVGVVGGHFIQITSRKNLSEENRKMLISADTAGLECFVLIDKALAAHFIFRDAPRKESRSFIQHLKPNHAIEKVMIVSGDRAEEVNYLAQSLGVTEVFASQSPQDKVDIVLRENKKAKTAFLGDGINDAPALVAATVGIAFGKNSDITAEAAGAVILESSLEKFDEFLHISRRMRKIAIQSAVGGMALSLIGMAIASAGFLPPVAGAITQEAIDVIVILNALRSLYSPSTLSDIA